jgi:flotillin
LANGQFVNFGSSAEGGRGAAASGSDDVMRVVQTLMAAQVITHTPLNRPAAATADPSPSLGSQAVDLVIPSNRR